MPVIIAILALVIVLFSLVGFIAKRLRRVPPNEALIIVGRGAGRTASADSTQRVVIGGRVFVWPILQQGFAMSLEQRQIGITVEGVDKNRIKIAIKASINFKVRGDEEGVRRAAQRFLSQQELLTEIIKESLEGSLRSIVGDMNIEQIISDRKGLSDRVVDSTKLDLAEQGLQVDLLNISDISTPGSDYLANLGRAESARARQVAEVSEAEAKRASEFAVIEAAEQIAERQKALDLRKASIKAETDRANAQAEASGQLARAEQDRLVATQQREALAEQAKVTEEELDISVRKPAEAEAYAKVQEAMPAVTPQTPTRKLKRSSAPPSLKLTKPLRSKTPKLPLNHCAAKVKQNVTVRLLSLLVSKLKVKHGRSPSKLKVALRLSPLTQRLRHCKVRRSCTCSGTHRTLARDRPRRCRTSGQHSGHDSYLHRRCNCGDQERHQRAGRRSASHQATDRC